MNKLYLTVILRLMNLHTQFQRLRDGLNLMGLKLLGFIQIITYQNWNGLERNLFLSFRERKQKTKGERRLITFLNISLE